MPGSGAVIPLKQYVRHVIHTSVRFRTKIHVATGCCVLRIYNVIKFDKIGRRFPSAMSRSSEWRFLPSVRVGLGVL